MDVELDEREFGQEGPPDRKGRGALVLHVLGRLTVNGKKVSSADIFTLWEPFALMRQTQLPAGVTFRTTHPSILIEFTNIKGWEENAN